MSENNAFSNRSYKINDNQWIESLQTQHLKEKKYNFTYAHTHYEIKSDRKTGERQKRYNLEFVHYLLRGKKSKNSAMYVLSLRMAKWKTIVVVWIELSSRYIHSHTHKHTALLATTATAEHSCEARDFVDCNFFPFCLRAFSFNSFDFALLSVSVLCMYDTIGP